MNKFNNLLKLWFLILIGISISIIVLSMMVGYDFSLIWWILGLSIVLIVSWLTILLTTNIRKKITKLAYLFATSTVMTPISLVLAASSPLIMQQKILEQEKRIELLKTGEFEITNPTYEKISNKFGELSFDIVKDEQMTNPERFRVKISKDNEFYYFNGTKFYKNQIVFKIDGLGADKYDVEEVSWNSTTQKIEDFRFIVSNNQNQSESSGGIPPFWFMMIK